MTNIISVIISSFALALSFYQFYRNNDRNKKEATLNAYKELQTEFSIIEQTEDKFETMLRGSEDWGKITKCLANIENFCVGINTGIYDINVLNRVGGGFFIEKFQILKPIIQRKREKENSKKIYEEFEKTVDELRKKRKK